MLPLNLKKKKLKKSC